MVSKRQSSPLKISPAQLDQPLEENMRSFFECAICLNLLVKPVGCPQCPGHFCSSCLEQSVKMTSPQCPSCRAKLPEDGSQNPPNPLLTNMMTTLKLKCEHCHSKVMYEFYEKHLNDECAVKAIECKHCDKKMPRSELLTHQALFCENAPITCQDCGKVSKRNTSYHNCMNYLKQKVGLLEGENEDLRKQLELYKSGSKITSSSGSGGLSANSRVDAQQ